MATGQHTSARDSTVDRIARCWRAPPVTATAPTMICYRLPSLERPACLSADTSEVPQHQTIQKSETQSKAPVKSSFR